MPAHRRTTRTPVGASVTGMDTRTLPVSTARRPPSEKLISHCLKGGRVRHSGELAPRSSLQRMFLSLSHTCVCNPIPQLCPSCSAQAVVLTLYHIRSSCTCNSALLPRRRTVHICNSLSPRQSECTPSDARAHASTHNHTNVTTSMLYEIMQTVIHFEHQSEEKVALGSKEARKDGLIVQVSVE